jgi:hypothetical protein
VSVCLVSTEDTEVAAAHTERTAWVKLHIVGTLLVDSDRWSRVKTGIRRRDVLALAGCSSLLHQNHTSEPDAKLAAVILTTGQEIA